MTADDFNNFDIWLVRNAKIYSERRADESVSLETRHHGAVLPTYCVLLCCVVLCCVPLFYCCNCSEYVLQCTTTFRSRSLLSGEQKHLGFTSCYLQIVLSFVNIRFVSNHVQVLYANSAARVCGISLQNGNRSTF